MQMKEKKYPFFIYQLTFRRYRLYINMILARFDKKCFQLIVPHTLSFNGQLDIIVELCLEHLNIKL